VANAPGDHPNFDDLKLPEDESSTPDLTALESAGLADFGEMSLPMEPDALGGGAADELNGEVAAMAIDESAADELKVVAAPKGKKGPRQLPPYVEWCGVAGVAVVLLAIAFFGLLSFPTAIYLISLGLIPYGIWKNRKTTNVYVVILACALAAILTAIFCLWLELGRYKYHIKAKPRVAVSAPAFSVEHLPRLNA
jgi:hypothetical protein